MFLRFLLIFIFALPLFAQEQVKNPAVLFAGFKSKASHTFAHRLVRENIAVNSRKQSLDASALTWEEVKGYNVLALAGLGHANADGSVTPRDQKTIATIQRFIHEGGGVFFVPSWIQMDSLIAPQTELMKVWGAVPGFEEIVFDREKTIRSTTWEIDFSFASPVSQSPLTQGTTGLWIPVGSRVGMQAHLVPFQLDDQWTIDFEGSNSTFSKTVPGDQLHPGEVDRTGIFDKSVPLVAHRKVGPGRVVLCALRGQDWLWGEHAATTLEGIALDSGLGSKPSGGYRMFSNAVRWLAWPSQKSGKLGGAKTHPQQLENPYKPKPTPLSNWPKLDTEAMPRETATLPGIVGARTKLSGAKGTVAEWVVAAKQSGLKYLVFLEDFRYLKEPNFQKLLKECAAETNADFAAIPGFRIMDELGNSYFYASPDLRYPPADLLSEDGKVFVSFDAQVNSKNPRAARGQLNHTTLRYAYQFCGFRLMAGNYLFDHDAAPVSDWFANYQAVGVITREGERIIEDAIPAFLEMVDSGQSPLPMVVDLLDEPDAIRRSPWRTVLRATPKDGRNPVSDYFSKWHFYPENPAAIFVSEGPQIDYWSRLGPSDYEGKNPHDFVWQNLRFKVGGRIRSAVGIREIVVYDGTHAFRRFRPEGATDYEFTLDLTHDCQRNLVLMVTDLYGRRAVSSELWSRNQRMQEVMCADRNNQLSYGYTIRESDGTSLLLGGNGALSTPNKRVIDRHIRPAGVFKNDPILGAAAFDGATGNDPQVFTNVRLLQSDHQHIKGPRVGKSSRLLHTGDVNIGEGVASFRFDNDVEVHNVWHSLWQTKKSENIVVTQRNHLFQVDPDSPLSLSLVTMRVEALRDLPRSVGLELAEVRRNDAKNIFVKSSNGTVVDQAANGGSYLMPFHKGAYVAALDSPLGGCALVPLSSALNIKWTLPSDPHPKVVAVDQGVPRKKGEITETDFLLIGLPRETKYTKKLRTKTRAAIERFIQDFGLGDQPSTYKVEVKSGNILDQRYPLRIDGKKDQAFSGKLRGNLVTTLPVIVSGLNDNWSAFLLDHREKRARPLGVFENSAWATLRMRGENEVFIGHPIICDNPDLVIQVTQLAEDRWRAEVHNPTLTAIKGTLKANPLFPLITAPAKSLEIPPGHSLKIDF